MNNIKEFLNKNKKKFIVTFSIMGVLVIGGTAALTGFAYHRLKSNIAYTVDQSKDIALANTPGEVVKVEKDFDLEDATLEYTFKIKDDKNMLHEVTVDSRLGVITEIERCDDLD